MKKRLVEEGVEAALGGRQGRRPSYVRKADGEFEARAAWQRRRDRLKAKVNWQFSTDDARVKLQRLYPTFDA